jgi:SagB-type dehydrogenase family enzyme
MEGAGILCRTVMSEEGPVATVIPVVTRPTRAQEDLDPATPYVLCRFAYLRAEGDALLLESPRRDFRIELHDHRAACAVLSFTMPRRLADVEDAAAHEPLFRMLLETGFLGDASAPLAEPDRAWEFHDLLFHTRSRLGRHDRPYGGTYRRIDELPSLPAVKEPMSASPLALPRPDLNVLMAEDVPFTRVLEERRSVRAQGETPITRTQLGHLLYRAARVKNVFGGKGGELSVRPYPGGGAIYELELYPVVDRCDGLDSGLYHYCPLRHVLEPVAGRTPPVLQLLENAWMTMNRESRPQVVLMIAARFGRLAPKYESMAYALVLKDVGVLDQTLYLVATAMGLAPCALGGGDSELFAAASGLDPLVEGAVGELAIGSVASGKDAS